MARTWILPALLVGFAATSTALVASTPTLQEPAKKQDDKGKTDDEKDDKKVEKVTVWVMEAKGKG